MSALASNERDELLVGLKAPTLTPVLQLARDPLVRKRAQAAGARRCPANVPRLARIVALRREVAMLLGHETHAHSALRAKMARSPAEVHAFLDRVSAKLAPLRERDLRLLSAKKRQDSPR